MNLNELRPDSAATRVYAVGDIHGRLDLLHSLEAQIRADLATQPTAAPLICFLGDYVDRGPASAGVIEHLASAPAEGVRRIFLKGNHEERMLSFLDEPLISGPIWLKFGGREALASYGIPPAQLDAQDYPALRDALAAALPAAHLTFLRTLDVAFRWGDYLFVHAGVNPERPLSDQDPRDLMWIREPFQSSNASYGLRVVHGHVITPEPVLRANRIGLDTGAYKSGVLTCAVLEGASLRILQT